MHKGRLEAFTDGVIAVIITIMVLEMKVPQGTDFAALAPGLPVFLVYVLSYTNVAIFWNNHHHMLQVSERVDGWALWANMFLLFWLSLVPFVIRWMDETEFAALPTASYGFVLVMASIGYLLLERMLIAINGADSMAPRRRKRLESQAFPLDLCCGDWACLRSIMDRDRALYRRCAPLVCARPAD